MKWIIKTILVLFFINLLIIGISCSQPTVPASSETLKPSTTFTTSATSQTITDTSTPIPSPTPSPFPTPTPTIIPTSTQPTTTTTQNPSDNKTFYTAKIISGYETTYLTNGTSKQTPVYQDLYFDLNPVGYYTSKDAIFVPRIPTIPDYDDWFIRPQYYSGSFLKSWIFNWGYTIDPSIKTKEPITLSFFVYPKNVFESKYYLNPGGLLFNDLKGDIEPSATGIKCKRLVYAEYTVINPNEYVFLIRTNNAAAISDFWIKVGTESKIIQ
jgi:hypothetical protein